MNRSNFFDSSTLNSHERLAISVDVMRELSRYSDPRVMYQVFARRMAEIFPTSRQITISRRGVEAPNFRVTRFTLGNEPIDHFSSIKHHPQHEGGLLSELLYADEPRIINELHLDDNDPAEEYLRGQRSLLAIPIFERGSAQHVVVLTREQPAAFAPEQVPELVWMTNLFGRATQTLRLTQALQVAYDEADAEIRAVADLQESLLPREAPIIPGLDLAAHCRAAFRAGGDYYDFFPHGDGSLGVLIADVSGHGAAAAVVMAIAHSFANASDAPTSDASAFLTYMNSRLSGRYNRAAGSFVTAFYAVVNPKTHSLTYASAGHVSPWLVKDHGRLLNLNRVQRLPLGINPSGETYPEFSVPFETSDLMVAVTDGITEAVNNAGGVFGTERMHMLLKRKSTSTNETLVRILAAVDQFTSSAPQTDDRTVVVVRSVA